MLKKIKEVLEKSLKGIGFGTLIEKSIGAVIGIALGLFLWFHYVKPYLNPAPEVNTEMAVPAPKADEVKHEDKVEVTLPQSKGKSPTIKAYPSPVKGLIKLPREVILDTQQVVTDSSKVKSSERPTSVTQVLDINTGETKTYLLLEPTPWFEVENRGNASLSYGIKRNTTGAVGRLNIHEDLFQIKGIHLGGDASLYSDGDYFIGAGASYRW